MPRYADEAGYTPEEVALWEALKCSAGQSFQTMRGCTFTFAVRGNELFVDRKAKSVTRSTVNAAYRAAVIQMQTAGCVPGPKALGTFGASYLYPVFQSFGILCRIPEIEQETKP